MKTVIDQLKDMQGEIYTLDEYEFPALLDRIEFRQQVGERKYGHSIDRDDLTKAEWLQHLQEELMDAAVYVEKLLTIIEDYKEVPGNENQKQ